MAIRATEVRSGREIDLERAHEPEMAELLAELHRKTTSGDRPIDDRFVLECREHDQPGQSFHGAWVYLRLDPYKRWILAHFDASLGEHKASRMTDQHRWQQDYWMRAGSDAGHSVEPEKPIPGAKVDVLIEGSVKIGVEVQHSGMSEQTAKARTFKAARSGITRLWSGDRPLGPPKWAYRVPTVLTNELPHGFAPRGSWTVVNGLRKLYEFKCARPWFQDTTAQGFGGVCPHRRRPRPCGQWHPKFFPLGGYSVDDVAEQAPDGGLVPIDVPLGMRRMKATYLVRARDAARFAEMTAGTFIDPDPVARGATEHDVVGPIGPCTADVERRLKELIPQQQRRLDTRYMALDHTSACRYCGEPLREVSVRQGIRNHLRCWQDSGRP